MSQSTTTRAVDLTQLTSETGWLLTMIDDGTTRVVDCHTADVTVAQLEAAIDAHTPLPPPPTETETLQAQINELTDLILFGF